MSKRKVILLLGILAGIGIMAYPFVSTLVANTNQKSVAVNVSTVVQNTDDEKLKEIMKECEKYNSTLSGLESMYNENGTLKTVSEDEYMDLLDFGNGAMGTLEIPALNLEIPIYHGTTNETISKGAGHLYGSSLPVGGPSTHSVLVAHSGLATATLFTHLDELEAGNMVYVHILNEIHAYTVTGKEIVQPEQVDSLGITADKDLLTLVTCYPVTINTHRLLVNCERDESGDRAEETPEVTTAVIESVTSDNAAIWNEVNGDERNYEAEREANKAAIAITICIGIFFALSFTVYFICERKRGKK